MTLNGSSVLPPTSPALIACAADDVATLRAIFATSPRSALDSLSDWYSASGVELRTPLMVACESGSLECVLFLLSAGASTSVTAGPNRESALHIALRSGKQSAQKPSHAYWPDAAAGVSGLRLGGPAAEDSLRPAPEDQSEEQAAVISALNSDAFKMWSFKVVACTRTRAHDWVSCPFAHPGEKAARRDPRVAGYSAVSCADFRKGGCRRGDACPWAHGVFEQWLHPALYRTQACKDGVSCARRVCFFAHSPAELRQGTGAGAELVTLGPCGDDAQMRRRSAELVRSRATPATPGGGGSSGGLAGGEGGPPRAASHRRASFDSSGLERARLQRPPIPAPNPAAAQQAQARAQAARCQQFAAAQEEALDRAALAPPHHHGAKQPPDAPAPGAADAKKPPQPPPQQAAPAFASPAFYSRSSSFAHLGIVESLLEEM